MAIHKIVTRLGLILFPEAAQIAQGRGLDRLKE